MNFLPAGATFSERRRKAQQICLLVAAVALAFFPVLGGKILVWDDQQLLLNDSNLKTLTLENFFGLWSRIHDLLYIPAVQSVWFLNGVVFGQWNPAALHATNLVLHGLNVVLVFRLLRKLMPFGADERDWVAFVAALVFAVHPMRLEPVAWIAGLKDVLSTSWGLASILFYLRSREREERWLVNRVLSVALMLLGLAAKPSLVVLPLCLVILEWVPGVDWKLVGRRIAIYVVAAAAFAVVAVATQAPHALLYVPSEIARVLVAIDAFGFYLLKFFWPVIIAPDYGRTPSLVLAETALVIPTVLAVLVSILAIAIWKKRDVAKAYALVWISLLPVLGLVPFYFQQTSTVADRYFYFPAVWFSLTLAFVIAKFAPRTIVRRGLLAALVALSTFSIYKSNQLAPEWEYDQRFFNWMFRENPRSFTALNRLGDIEADQGRYQAALAFYTASRKIAPWQPYPWLRQAHAQWQLGNKDEALTNLRALVTKYPTYTPAVENLKTLTGSN